MQTMKNYKRNYISEHNIYHRRIGSTDQRWTLADCIAHLLHWLRQCAFCCYQSAKARTLGVCLSPRQLFFIFSPFLILFFLFWDNLLCGYVFSSLLFLFPITGIRYNRIKTKNQICNALKLIDVAFSWLPDVSGFI